jgi:hypothetical protein
MDYFDPSINNPIQIHPIHPFWHPYSIHITLVVNIGFGARSIFCMKVISPKRFILLPDDTPEDSLPNYNSDIVEGENL